MARFRNNEQQQLVEPIYQHQGLKIERAQCIDRLALPELARWRAWSFRIALGGTSYLRYGGQDRALAPNTIVWHAPLKDLARIRCLPGTSSDVVVVTYSAERWHQFVTQSPFFGEHNAGLLRLAPQAPLLAVRPAPPALLQAVRRLIGLSRLASVAALEPYCAQVQQQLGELQFVAEDDAQPRERQQRVEAAQGRMVACLARPPSLLQLAADLNVSPRQLQRDFLACTGLTPIGYLNAVRLSEASRLLAETSLPVAEIARQLGYTSLPHFSAAFRQMYRCSPRDLREAPADLQNQLTEA